MMKLERENRYPCKHCKTCKTSLWFVPVTWALSLTILGSSKGLQINGLVTFLSLIIIGAAIPTSLAYLIINKKDGDMKKRIKLAWCFLLPAIVYNFASMVYFYYILK